MLTTAWIRWAVTALFMVAAVSSATWCVQERSTTAKITNLCHLLMSLSMIAMAWPWGLGVLTLPQAAIFTGASLWFLLLLPTRRVLPTRRDDEVSRTLEHRWHLAFHAAMMAAMVWMLLAMPPTGDAGSGAGTAVHHHASALPTWSAMLGVAFTVALLGGAVVLVADRFALGRPKFERATSEAVVSALMSVGMIAMIFPMIQV